MREREKERRRKQTDKGGGKLEKEWGETGKQRAERGRVKWQ